MDHLGLVSLVSLSYLATILIYRRARLLVRRSQGLPPRLLRRLHVRAVLAPLVQEAPEMADLVEPLEVGRLAEARSSWQLLAASLRADRRPWVEAILALAEAERERRFLRRYSLAARARKEAALARRGTAEPGPTYLYLTASLGYLLDPLNFEIAFWQSGWFLKRALAANPKEPLLHLSAALRAAAAGETAESLQALARALYHARGDPFIAALIAGLPRIDELDPALAAEATRLLDETPSAAISILR
jgi:hypothetical protein